MGESQAMTAEPPSTTPDADATYDRFAIAYRDWWGPVIAPAGVRVLDRLDGRLPLDRPLRLVDIGAGTGTVSLAALRRWPNLRVVAIDPARRMLEFAAAAARSDGLGDRLETEVGEAGRLPIPDVSADAAMSTFVLQLVANRAAAVREAFRVLRPGGVFAILTWRANEGPFEPTSAFEDALDELDIDDPDLPAGAGHSYTSAAAAAAELRRAGFRSVRAREEWLEHRFTPGSYLEVLEHWVEDEVFAAQDEPMRQRLRDAVLRRLERLDPEALLWRRPLVSVVGQRPG